MTMAYYSHTPRFDVERAQRLGQAMILQGGAVMVTLALVALDRMWWPHPSHPTKRTAGR